ncbi:alpha and gamma adaptin binding protein p34-domain-containing protein [Podospora australis]|uniref:Alpha and gamma adaptin binding protein p34-domain-containing protein n=1 Tax=Podospora australis TaxID=1536484 RepID=A0AAN6X6J4_9PEZI|nr:alpha and gamma adaptin binding protein p34-domain-containing protein [Podospora australis]
MSAASSKTVAVAKEVSNPRRILAVSLADSALHLSGVIKDLTGAHPEPAVAATSDEEEGNLSTIAGTTHLLPLTTAYYTASVPIWLDLVSSSPEEWASSFLSEEAKEVLSVLGGVVVVFNVSSSSPASSSNTKELLKHVGRVVKEGLGGWEWDGVGIAVGVGAASAAHEDELDEWEDLCVEAGLEFVHLPTTATATKKNEDKRNEYGERMGIARVLEALQANDWSGGDVGDEEDEESEDEGAIKKTRDLGRAFEDDEFDFDPESLDFGFDKADFEGLKKAIWGGGDETGGEEGSSSDNKKADEEENMDDSDIQTLERMMLKLQAVRDMSAGLPEQQRKRMAKQAVSEVMKEL